jgi:hypothetical protein
MLFFGVAVRVGQCSGVVNISYELSAVADVQRMSGGRFLFEMDCAFTEYVTHLQTFQLVELFVPVQLNVIHSLGHGI